MGQVQFNNHGVVNLAPVEEPESEPLPVEVNEVDTRGPSPAPAGAQTDSAAVAEDRHSEVALQRLEFELQERQAQQQRLAAFSAPPASSSRALARGAAARGRAPVVAVDTFQEPYTLPADPVGASFRTFEPSLPSAIFCAVPSDHQIARARMYAVWDLPGHSDLRGIHWAADLSAWQGIRSLAHHYVVAQGGDPAAAWELVRWQALRRITSVAQAEAAFAQNSFAGSPTWYLWPAGARPRR